MPYITLAEQGIRRPGEVIQDAARNFLVNQQLQQQMKQQREAFPIEQQQRQAQATRATTEAEATPRNIELDQHAKELGNQLSQSLLALQKETNPLHAQLLREQTKQIAANIDHLIAQGSLVAAQTKEAVQREALLKTQTDAARRPLLNSTVTPGELDPYGNQVITTKRTDESGKPVQSEQTFERGRGIPRVAYRTQYNPQSGLNDRIPGVVQMDEATGQLNVSFPDDANAKDTGPTQPDNLFKAIAEKYFDSATGDRNDKAPASASDRAQLRMLQKNPKQLEAWGLNPYSDGAGTLKKGGMVESIKGFFSSDAPKKPTTVTSSTTSAPGPSPVGGASSAQPSGTTAGAPAVIQPNPADGPQAGITPGGAPVKTGADAPAGKPAAAASGTPLASGRKPAGTFKDLPVGSFFMQNGVKFRKTSATEAVPANAEPAAPAGGSQAQSLPKAGGM